MDPRTKESLLWGVVGTLAFLVLAQGYQLLVASLDFAVVMAVAVAVGALTAALAHRLRTRLVQAADVALENESP